MAPSSFAEAANNQSRARDARDGTAEWARRTNGTTQTFRRSSGAAPTSTSSQQPDAMPTSQPPPRYVPPHRNGTYGDMRYSKDQLLDLFRSQQGADGGFKDGLSDLYVAGWQPDAMNGFESVGWGRPEHSRDAQPAPDICWDRDGHIEPLGLQEMDEEETELFSTSVNTPLKAPTTSNKDGQQANGLPGRKTSISNISGTPGGFGLPSPSATRGLGRRRETSESYPFPSNPLSTPTAARDDHRAPSPPPSLLRRRTDVKDASKSEDRTSDAEDKSAVDLFGTVRRNPAAAPLSAGFAAPSSPWTNTPQSAGLPPMGSFGSFGLAGQQSTANDKRPGLGSGRAESRFKNLLNKDSNEEIGSPSVQRKASMSSLSRVNENESWRPQGSGATALAEAQDEVPSGSAALAAGSEISPAQQRQGNIGFGTPSRTGTQDEYGFGAFGMTADNAHAFGQGTLHGRDSYQQSPAAHRMGPPMGGNEAMSPTDTNPYRSPEQNALDRLTEDPDTDGLDLHNAHLPGLGGFGHEQTQQLGGGLGGLGALPSLGRAGQIPGPASDRSQTSSAGANRGFGGLGGLGQLGNVPGSAAWPATQPGFGTPGRPTAGLSSAFGGGIFATSAAELQSPSLAGLGPSGVLGPQNGAGLGGSRMASMFPQAMQEQMRQSDERNVSGDRLSQQPFGNLGLDGSGELQSQFAREAEQQSQHPPFGAPGQQQPGDAPAMHQDEQQSQQPPPSSASNQPPAPQQRTMVMPDRMRWIYRDPQGQTQGPWSGLEMHDWYKAGFFSPELLVKKFEDPDYEPLAQLIRRIGNSREPFLVPQIGIPHGPSNNGPTSWAGGAPAVGSNPTSSGGAQPPFASSFPSFGTTLTAEQQNALERRKQEEQYLMARQKEHLAQAQIASRMVPGGAHHSLLQGQLHHHSSAQSLHSQPSFGSITSPTAFQPSPIQAPSGGAGHVPGFFDNSFRSPQSGGLGAVGAGVDSLGHIREEEIPGIMDRLDLGTRTTQSQFGAPGQPYGQQQQAGHEQQVQQMLQDRARLQQEQAQYDAAQQQTDDDHSVPNERLQQFQQLQQQPSAPGAGLDARFLPAVSKPLEQQSLASAAQSSTLSPVTAQQQPTQPREPLSLTEQVEQAVSAQQSPIPQQVGLPQPFPPAPSQSPLPAPAAQRTGRQSVADQLQTESRDLSQTPSVDTPSAAVAPWAKEPAEAARGPSLKEIQEAEARKAAEAEALAAAARRAAFEKEMEAQTAAPAVQPGLPASASWATAGSPATPTSATASAWAKAAQKPTGAPAKTMAQIQKEEEARKRKLAAAAANAQPAMSGVAVPAGGKSYANLAGKVNSLPPATGAGAWTTVGASGKTKTPVAAASPAPVQARAVSSGIVPTVQLAAGRKPPSRSSTLNSAGAINAHDEFKKWAVGELRPDLSKGISADDFVNTLLVLPNEPDMITEAVHSASNTIDSRHFAEEFLRRKRLADKGLIDTTVPPKSASPHNAANNQAGGWSEVAKKGPVKEAAKGEESNGSFRVVAAKKKGAKR